MSWPRFRNPLKKSRPRSERPPTVALLETPSGSFAGTSGYSDVPHPVVQQLVVENPGLFNGARRRVRCDKPSTFEHKKRLQGRPSRRSSRHVRHLPARLFRPHVFGAQTPRPTVHRCRRVKLVSPCSTPSVFLTSGEDSMFSEVVGVEPLGQRDGHPIARCRPDNGSNNLNPRDSPCFQAR